MSRHDELIAMLAAEAIEKLRRLADRIEAEMASGHEPNRAFQAVLL